MINVGSNEYSECMGQGVPNLIIGFSGAMGVDRHNDGNVRDIGSIGGLEDIALELRHHRAVVTVMGLDKASDTLVNTSVMRQRAQKSFTENTILRASRLQSNKCNLG